MQAIVNICSCIFKNIFLRSALELGPLNISEGLLCKCADLMGIRQVHVPLYCITYFHLRVLFLSSNVNPSDKTLSCMIQRDFFVLRFVRHKHILQPDHPSSKQPEHVQFLLIEVLLIWRL